MAVSSSEVFKCVRCPNKFLSTPCTACPACGSLYVVWLSYTKWKARHGLYPYDSNNEEK